MPNNVPDDPRYNRSGGGLGGKKPRVRAQAGSGRGGSLVPRKAPGVPAAGSGGGSAGSGGGSGGGQPPAPRDGGSRMPQGGGRVPATRGNTQPATRPGAAPRGSVWGGDLTGSANKGDLPPPRRGGVPQQGARALDYMFYEALRDKSSPAGAFFRMLLRGAGKAAGPIGAAGSLLADSTPLNEGEATENPQGDSPYANALEASQARERGMQAGNERRADRNDAYTESMSKPEGGDTPPKPSEKPTQDSQGSQATKSQGGSQKPSQPSGGDSEARLSEGASLGDKIAFGRMKGWPVIEHEGRVYVEDPDSPTGYRFGGELQKPGGGETQQAKSQESGGYSMEDFMNDVREGPSDEDAKRITEKWGGRDK